jgi:hypothetical protein
MVIASFFIPLALLYSLVLFLSIGFENIPLHTTKISLSGWGGLHARWIFGPFTGFWDK